MPAEEFQGKPIEKKEISHLYKLILIMTEIIQKNQKTGLDSNIKRDNSHAGAFPGKGSLIHTAVSVCCMSMHARGLSWSTVWDCSSRAEDMCLTGSMLFK